jgi:peptide deformylase
MRRALAEAEGAGLAATQVGFMRRVFVYRASLEDEIDALVNPAIVSASEERTTFVEGCLSYQALVVAVVRPVAVRVRAQRLDGRERELDVEGYEASLLQHEIDHLDGILTLDRADAAERRRAISELIGDADERGIAA